MVALRETQGLITLEKFVLGSMIMLVLAIYGRKDGNASSSTPTQPVSAPGSLVERANSKGTITVGTEGTHAPFTYHDKDSKSTGYDAEVTRAIVGRLSIRVESKGTQWDSMMAGLKAGRLNVAVNQVGSTSPERQATFDKSEPCSWSGTVLVVHNNSSIKSIDGIKSVETVQFLTSNYSGKARAAGTELVPVDGLVQPLALTEQEHADTTLNDELAVLGCLEKSPNASVKIVWSTPADEKAGSGLIVSKGNDKVITKLSAAINRLKTDGILEKLGG